MQKLQFNQNNQLCMRRYPTTHGKAIKNKQQKLKLQSKLHLLFQVTMQISFSDGLGHFIVYCEIFL